jgi:tetratricopeptide (TPR) repeat protein
MKIGKRLFLFLLGGLLASCAGLPTSVQSVRAEMARLGLPDKASVADVPFVAQTENTCGPATLAMALAWSGVKVPAEKLAAEMMTPGREGTFQADLLGAARREGFLALPVRNYRALFQELAAGHPVIVLQNLGLSWFPKWHYALAIGYDLERSEITLHSGKEALSATSLRRFDVSWELAGNWGVTVLPPTASSPTADEVDHLEAAAALERIGRDGQAASAYGTILKRWPKSLGAWVGLGNVRFKANDLKGAVSALEKAVEYHPQVPATWHNLALAYHAQRRARAARAAARKALALAPEADTAEFSESLRAIRLN